MNPMTPRGGIRCDLCSIDFTSHIPFEMHINGAKHAKKLKTQNAMQTIQMQATKDVAGNQNVLKCELCNISVNSSLQLQMHLDGIKHKTKLEKIENEGKAKPDTSQVNGKSNGGGVVRPLPPEFGEPAPKMAKFSCSTCSIIVNSSTQLEQHLTSKKHQAKLEGKPIQKKRFKQKEELQAEEAMQTGGESGEAANDSKTVVGVKTLANSFVQGEVLK